MKKKDLERRLAIIEEKLGISNQKTNLVVGKWYKYPDHENWKLCITSIDGNEVGGYGVDLNGGWMRSGKWGVIENKLDELIECTPQEIKEALEREAKRRYKVGDKVECLVSRMPSIITEPPYVSTSSSVNAETDCLVSGYIYLFQNGEWAEVVERTSDKIDLHVGLKFTTRYSRHIYEITSIYDIYVSIGWKGIKDRVDYLICDANRFITNGDWKVYEPTDKFAELKEAHRNGAVIQCKPKCTMNYSCWVDEHNPKWNPKFEYRIKPEEEPNVGDVVKAWCRNEEHYVVGNLTDISTGTENKYGVHILGVSALRNTIYYANAKPITKQEAIKLLFGDE